MGFSLHVDAERWRAHAVEVRDKVCAAACGAGSATSEPWDGLVPVAKGNGYGLGNARLAREAARLGVTTLAVGTASEVAQVADRFGGDVLVLNPYQPADASTAGDWAALGTTPYAARVLRTVSSLASLRTLAHAGQAATPVRVVVEGLTSLRRFGMTADDLGAALADPVVRRALQRGALVLEGLALHLPLVQPVPPHRRDPGAQWHDAAITPALAPADAEAPSAEGSAAGTARVREVLAWAYLWHRLLAGLTSDDEPVAAEQLSAAAQLWVSHLGDRELGAVHAAVPDLRLRARLGTRLWLGDRSALAARGTVLAVHALQRGDRSGYRQRRATRAGALLVIAGGTAHGVALEAPSPAASVRQRMLAAGSGVLEAGGLALSPFTVAGRQRWFAEPPHMQVSLVQVGEGVQLPAVGDQVDCEIRLTTATFDQVIGLD